MNIITQQSFLLLLVFAALRGSQAFTSPRNVALNPTKSRTVVKSTTSSEVSYEPVFDFGDASKDAVASFDRIDDAIMGGISTSSIRASGNDDESYASWSGVCRTEGGGFCGARTLPFRDGVPLEAKGKDGFYLKVRLVSDNEPEKRIWKITTRVENVSRSEQLYQADFQIPKQDLEDGSEWKTVKVPFESFVQVRGPITVENGPPLDVSGGLFQIGMTMSKFQISKNLKELPDFRPGYFELQLKEIGVYSNAKTAETTSVEAPKTLTKKEADQKKPVMLKILFPIAKLFFNEQSQRKKSATKLLQKRGLSKLGIFKFGFQRKVASKGIIVALAQTLVGLVSAGARLAAFWTLKICLFYPLMAIRRITKKLKSRKETTTPATE